MNKRLRNISFLLLSVLLVIGATSSVVLNPGDNALVTCSNVIQVTQTANSANVICPQNTATATQTPVATATATATPTGSCTVTLGWHAPAAHDGLNVHEHGDAPPAWVLASAHQPFTQCREFHTGYKGSLTTDQGGKGVVSYLITHILATTAARSHGDHDYQLWVKTPGTGVVSYWAGQLDFGSPPPHITADDGTRPVILSKGDLDCETWYNRPGSLVFDLGWTICGRYQNFAGVTTGGNGSYRGMDWSVYPDRFVSHPGADPNLANYCTVSYGVCKLFFLMTGHQYPVTGVMPIN